MGEKSGSMKQKAVVYDPYDSENEEDGGDLLGGTSLEKLSLARRKKLLILSLGGLLCQRVCRREKHNIPQFRTADASYGSILVYRRPHCDHFMKFCLERFEVGIWSSAKEWYLNHALDSVMDGALRRKLTFAWDQNECTDSGFGTLEKKEKPIFLKELKKVWDGLRGQYSSSNTLLIDDKPYKALLNPPYTAIFPTEYKADNLHDTALGSKGELRLYLDGLAEADDVPSYVKGHPFGQPAITATHPDWDYYHQIILRHGQLNLCTE